MPEDEAWSVGRLLVWTTEYLGRRGSDTARLDAEVLLSNALRCERIELYTAYENVPAAEPLAAFRQLVRRRAEGTPVAYLVGRREFYSMSFRVTPDVLIPRPETELLVVTLLDLLKNRPADGPPAICDVGTGSGILAVCAARHVAGCRVTALDLSPAALEVARSNAAAHGVDDRIELIHSDLFAAVPSEMRFDFILSNPPYVSRSEMEKLAPDVRNFEPPGALVAGPTGTEVIEKLVPQAAERLNPGGHLLIEVSPMIHEAVEALIESNPHLDLGPTVKDLAQKPRVVQAVAIG